MKTFLTRDTFECPECGCHEIHLEYDERVPVITYSHTTEPTGSAWCYCLCCGVMFNPEQEQGVLVV